LKAEIICIGTELLLGQIVDTNAAYLAKELAELGIDLYHKSTVGDNLERIIATLGQAWKRSDLLIISGGLGPTQDDLTREAVAGLLHEELEFNSEAWKQVRAYFEKTGRPISENNRRQAMFPRSGRVIPNSLGTAPAMLVEKDEHILITLPGVPSELRGLWEASFKPYLRRELQRKGQSVLNSLFVRMIGIGEAAMEEKIIDLIRGQTNPTIAPYASRGEVALRITAKSENEEANLDLIKQALDWVKERLGQYIYGYNQDNLETVIGRMLKTKGWRLGLAESCTGGLIGHRITNVPGSSEYYLGGVNCYSNQLKISLLGLAPETLASHGAVSPETAKEMAEGIRKRIRAEVGLAITGIAGPGGESEGKPVGLIYLAVALPDRTEVERRLFPFDRIGNKEAAAQAGLALLWRCLKESGGKPEVEPVA
jgi:nicotinamide-nucleotide amidase